MIWLRYVGASSEEQTKMHGFGSYPLIGVRDWSVLDRSLRSIRTKGLVGHYVLTDSFTGRSLRSDRPNGLVDCYVAAGSFADRSLCGDLVWILF
ncbi:hypothetical protein F2Q69_00036430 [Brassica cretica]|uniref:Uncharacterized protein n=1 Tax=Brassica cretica TaxID=69181 RepID=A0A8S9SF56_BRACR|nr:hypothetical protein F2Q69_00036430 [Brassica cretica]